MDHFTRTIANLAENLVKSIWMTPLVVAIIFVPLGAFAIGFNYKGDIKVALNNRVGWELIINGCRR